MEFSGGNLLVLVTFDFQLNVAFGEFVRIIIFMSSWLALDNFFFYIISFRSHVCHCHCPLGGPLCVHVVYAFRVHFTFNFGAFSSHTAHTHRSN